jgi:hypothetical protein
MDLPTFKYHPDPVGTRNVKASDTSCVCCGQVRGWVYVGPVYAKGSFEDCICPWCVADGSAHERFDAEFTDSAGVGGGGLWDSVPDSVVEEVAFRTPGFYGWQQEQWWTHCNVAARFLGRAGRRELEALGPEAVAAIQASTGLTDGPEWSEFLAGLEKDGSPTAYVFECSACGALGGYQDCG